MTFGIEIRGVAEAGEAMPPRHAKGRDMDGKTNSRRQTFEQSERFYLGEAFVRAAIEEGIEVALDRIRSRVAAAISEDDAATLRVCLALAEKGAAHYQNELLVERARFLAGARRPGAPVPRLSITVTS
jgi:hypothetical protein